MFNRVYYLRDRKNLHLKKDGTLTRGNPVAALVMKVNYDEATLEYALSVVHPKDHFEKKRGRSIALARLNIDPIQIGFDSVEDMPKRSFEITRTVIEDLIKDDQTPPRAIEAARLWLAETEIKYDEDEVPTQRNIKVADVIPFPSAQ